MVDFKWPVLSIHVPIFLTWLGVFSGAIIAIAIGIIGVSKLGKAMDRKAKAESKQL